MNNYLEWSKQTRDPYPVDRYRLGQVLSAVFEPYRPRARNVTGVRIRRNAYKLGPLDEARRKFAAARGWATRGRSQRVCSLD